MQNVSSVDRKHGFGHKGDILGAFGIWLKLWVVVYFEKGEIGVGFVGDVSSCCLAKDLSLKIPRVIRC